MNNTWQLMRTGACTAVWNIERLETDSVVNWEEMFWAVYIRGVRSGSPFPTREEAEEYALIMLRIMR